MNTDSLSVNTSWIGQWNADIAPVAPKSSNIVSVPDKDPSWLLSTAGTSDPTGKEYPGVLFCPGANGKAIPRPILPNEGNVSLAFDLWTDEATLAAANSIESDLLIVQNGLKFAMSGQRLMNGQLQVGSTWDNVGSPLGALNPYQKYKIRWKYNFSLIAKTCSTLFYECNNVPTAVVTEFPVTVCTWDEGAYIQMQMSSLPAGDPWDIRIGNVKIIWS